MHQMQCTFAALAIEHTLGLLKGITVTLFPSLSRSTLYCDPGMYLDGKPLSLFNINSRFLPRS